jgi:large subunit ribosomal protein L31e
MAEEIERIYVIPLKNTGFKSSKAAPTAIKRVKNYLTRHMKVEKKNIWIDDSLNTALWSQGKYKMPSKIRVKAVKFDDGVVEAYIPELEFKKSRRELLKEEREKKEPILKKEEVESEKGEGEAVGAEEYEIKPTADGEVKIKKKKAHKEKKEEKPKEKPKKKKEGKPKTTKKTSSIPKSKKKKSPDKKSEE